MQIPRRYLVRLNPRRAPHYFTDVLIIGGGLAGLRAALEVPPNLETLIVTKDKLEQSNSHFAQGGIAGVLDPEDCFENHIEDTIKAGAGICEREVVEAVVRAAPRQIQNLIDWGTHFDEEGDTFALTLEGGHSHRRIIHALGDATGKEVMRAVIGRARTVEHLAIWENTFALDVLTDEGRCIGAVVHRPGQGFMFIWARQTILAGGGTGCIYRETTNPPVATGDGLAMAYRAGAALCDMEFMQFHPTALYVAGSSRYLISEAVRGEGAYLRDKNGYRFMPEEDPRAELAPRDVVARAIVHQMEQTKHPNVYLDLTHLDPEHVRKRFPGISKVCHSFNIDITRDAIPVRPGAHYMIGGVAVNLNGRTSVPNLWACGEVTSSGLHGANRLASNSLLEGLVFGTWCGQGAAKAARDDETSQAPIALMSANRMEVEPLDVSDVRNALRSLMGRKAGIVRTAQGLEEAAADVDHWCRYVLDHEFTSPEGWELQNMLTVSKLLVWAAQERTESRGTHYREDFPDRDDANWQRRLRVPIVGSEPVSH